MIEIKNLNKSFEGTQILKDVSMVFEKGKTNLIIGKSGSGKTVLIKSILGLFEIDSGEIWYDNDNFTRMNAKQVKKKRQDIGMVFQHSALFDSMSVEENVQFPLDMFSTMSGQEKKQRVEMCLDRVNIESSKFRLSPAEISGGMQKRVAIARAIVMNPKYLFCDEPNSGLDPETATIIDQLIQEITQDYNITTIINTHDMNSVIEIGEKILLLHNGEKGWEGTKDEILQSNNEYVNDFIFANKLYKLIKEEKF